MIIKKIGALVILASALCVTAAAQGGSSSKVGVVDSTAFSQPKTGIKRLLTALATVETQIKPLRDEIGVLRTRYDALVKEINSTAGTADAASPGRKTDQAEKLQDDIKRKQEDGEAQLNKRLGEATEPIDVSKVPVFLINQSIDITASFIADYNSKNP